MIEIRTILAPTDFSPHAEKAVRFACGLAERFEAELHLLHVQSRQALSESLAPSWGRPRSVVTVVRWGTPVEEIVAYAREASVDLIVIATHGRTGLSHVLLGSVAERMIREAPCPTLTIRSRD